MPETETKVIPSLEHSPPVFERTPAEFSEEEIWELAKTVQDIVNEAGASVDNLLAAQNKKHQELEKFSSPLELPEEETQRIFQKHGLEKGLELIKKRAEALLRKLKKSLRVGLGAYTLLYPGAGVLGQGKQNFDYSRPSAFTEIVDDRISEETIKKSIFYDKKEWAILGTNLDGEDYSKSQEGRQSGVPINLDAFVEEESEDPEVKEIKFAHTHPLSSYQYLRTLKSEGGLIPSEYSFEEVEKFKNGEQMLPPLPPSSTDVHSLVIATIKYAKFKNITIHSQLFEPTGKWDFTADFHHPFLQFMVKLVRDIDETEENFFASITEEEKNKIREAGGHLNDSEDMVNIMMKNKISLPKARKYRAIYKTLDRRNDFIEEWLGSLELKAHAIRTARQSSSDARQVLINDYIATCRELGVNMIYYQYYLKLRINSKNWH